MIGRREATKGVVHDVSEEASGVLEVFLPARAGDGASDKTC